MTHEAAPSEPASDFARDGAALFVAALSPDDLQAALAAADALSGGPGVRVFGDARLSALLASTGALGRIATGLIGPGARPVRAVLFDKTAERNWAVAWHQDRTVAVRERRQVEGFGAWSVKAGVTHVEPPFAVIERMVTLRAHLDDCDADNAPLLFAPGSHKLGRAPADQAAEIARRLGPRACLASSGDVWAYATAVLHASERAARPRRRRVLQVDFAADELPGGLRWLGVG